MPHIHGVAWISDWYLKQQGFTDMCLSNAPKDKVIELANDLISCQLVQPFPVPASAEGQERDRLEEQFKHDKKLMKIVSEVYHNSFIIDLL